MDRPGTYEEWRVTGEPGNGFPAYDFVWSQRINPHLRNPEVAARGFVAQVGDAAGWLKGPHLSHRTVVVGEWET